MSRAQLAVTKSKPAKAVSYKKRLTYRDSATPKFLRDRELQQKAHAAPVGATSAP